MKRLFALSIVLALVSCASNTSFNTFYKDNQEDSDFSFGISSSLVAGFLPDEDFEEIKPLLKKAKHVRILVFSENPADKSQKFDRFISRSKFEKMVRIKSDGDNLALFTLEDKNRIREVVMEVSTGEELVLVGLKTNLSPEDMEQILQ